MFVADRPAKRCSVENCDRRLWALGFCSAHYQRQKRYGDPRAHIPITPRRTGCLVDGCDQKHSGHGYCLKHYRAWKLYGDPLESRKKVHVVEHGTYNEYQNYGCRCDKCKKAMAHYNRAKLQTGRCSECGAPIWETSRARTGLCAACLAVSRRTAEHGTETRYNRGCRCDECRAASAAARRRRRAANLEATRAYYRKRYYLKREVAVA